MIQGASYGYPHLASHEEVFEPDNGFLQDKTVTMGVHISLIAKVCSESVMFKQITAEAFLW